MKPEDFLKVVKRDPWLIILFLAGISSQKMPELWQELLLYTFMVVVLLLRNYLKIKHEE